MTRRVALFFVVVVVVVAGALALRWRPAEAAAPVASQKVLASIGQKQVVLADLEREFPDVFLKMRQQEYRNLMSFLEAHLLREAVTADANAAGKNLEEYIQSRMKVRPITDADVARMLPRFGSDEQELRRVLADHRREEARRDAVQEILAAKGAVIALEPPRFTIPVTVDDAVRGPANAPITIVEYSDFTCGFCALARPTVERVLEKYGKNVRLVYKHAPRNGEGARLAQFTLCAQNAGMFWQAHDYLFTAEPVMGEDMVDRARTHLKLPEEKTQQCMASGATFQRLERDRTFAQSLGVRGTPTFFVNGMLVPYTNFYGDFTVLVDRERERLRL